MKNKKLKKVFALVAVFLVIQMVIGLAMSVIGVIRYRDYKKEYFNEIKNLAEISIGDGNVSLTNRGSEKLAIYDKMEEIANLGGYKGAVKYADANVEYYESMEDNTQILKSKCNRYLVGVDVEESDYDVFFDISKYLSKDQMNEYRQALEQDCALYSVTIKRTNYKYIPVEVVYKEIKIKDRISSFTDKVVFKYENKNVKNYTNTTKYYDYMVNKQLTDTTEKSGKHTYFVEEGNLWKKIYDCNNRLYKYLGKYDDCLKYMPIKPEDIDDSELIVDDGANINQGQYYVFDYKLDFKVEYDSDWESDYEGYGLGPISIKGVAIYDINALALADEGFRNFMKMILVIIEVVAMATMISILIIQRNNKKLDKMRNTFINAMAHEMKTPAAVIVNTSEMLLAGINPKKTEHYQTIVRDEAMHISDLLSDMLVYARMVGQGYKINNTNLIMEEEITSMVKHYEQEIENKNINYSFEKEGQWIVKGDQKLMSMVLDNLISNSIKYGNENVKITLQDGCLSVFNDGEQIPEKDLKDVWTPLFKSDESRGKKEGSGMGLAISAEILKQMNLKYMAENVEGGVVFSIFKKGSK